MNYNMRSKSKNPANITLFLARLHFRYLLERLLGQVLMQCMLIKVNRVHAADEFCCLS